MTKAELIVMELNELKLALKQKALETQNIQNEITKKEARLESWLKSTKKDEYETDLVAVAIEKETSLTIFKDAKPEAIEFLKKTKIGDKITETIHHSTLKSFLKKNEEVAKEMLGEGLLVETPIEKLTWKIKRKK